MGGLSRWNISSVTHKVISLIYLPVLIVRAYSDQESQPEKQLYQRILIPVDSSRRAECVFSTGIAIRDGQAAIQSKTKNNKDDSKKTTLLLVSVIKPPEIPIPEPYSDEIKQLQEQFLQVSREAVKNYLDSIKNHLSKDCETFLLEDQSVPTAIQELAEKENVDLILMSAHGYGGQFNYPYGSIVRHTIEHGSVPILIIQDIPLSQVKPTQAEIAARKYGSR
jgi:nucleotide-binding universal stress UspA family protein